MYEFEKCAEDTAVDTTGRRSRLSKKFLFI